MWIVRGKVFSLRQGGWDEWRGAGKGGGWGGGGSGRKEALAAQVTRGGGGGGGRRGVKACE